jgi:SSS family transporter
MSGPSRECQTVPRQIDVLGANRFGTAFQRRVGPWVPGWLGSLARGCLFALALLAGLVGPDTSVAAAANPALETLRWTRLPELPNRDGVAGAFGGTSNGALIVAGGTNFPGAKPWDGGAKVWHDVIYVLERPDGAWREAGRLPHPLAYGVSVSTADGVVCVGGSDALRHSGDTFRLRWVGGRIESEALPALPRPAANLSGAVLGTTLYVAGGTEAPDSSAALRTFWALDLSSAAPAWRELEPWPGPGRMLAVAAVQDRSFFLFSGASLRSGPDGKPVREYLRDAYRYRPGRGWERVADLPTAVVAAPSPAPALGQSSVVVLGGDDGTRAGFVPPAEHPGFGGRVLIYHTITDTWRGAGTMPAAHVATPLVAWQGTYVMPSGESRPGVRSPEVWALRSAPARASFGWLNYAVLALYLAGVVWIGYACSKRNQGTDDFFRGGQRIPWWAAGLSIFATLLSSITFMAIPANGYADGWAFFLANSYVLVTPLVVFVFLPFYRRLNVTSAYEYLELRFNGATRLAGSALFMLYQCGRIAVVLYLPALALSTVSDFNLQPCIVIMGVLCIVYTMEGGIEAVVWTDVAQAFLLMGGALFSLGFIIWSVDGGLGEAVRTASAAGRFFESVDWSWDLSVASGWVIIIGSLFHNLFPYTVSQDVVQRYVTTPTERAAARGIWLNALIAIPAQAVFFAIGTGLYLFYLQRPERLEPGLQNDAIFPFFIFSELPMGVAGLMVAAIFAAAQSTLSSSMNSVATAYVTDFHRRLRPRETEAHYFKVARLSTLAVGVVGTLSALLISTFEVRSLYTAFLEIIGLLGGSLSGLFLLGIFSRSAHGRGAVAGALISAGVVFTIRLVHPLAVYAYAPIGLLTCTSLGWLLSRVIPAPEKSIAGLTIHSLRRSP